MTVLLDLAEGNQYQDLFINELLWSAPDQPPSQFVDDLGNSHELTNVSSYGGIRVWTCGAIPDSAAQAAIDRHLGRTSTDRLLIFHEGSKQIWRWPVKTFKGSRASTRLARHEHTHGTDASKLNERLATIRLTPDDRPSPVELLNRLRVAFDVESENETKRASKLMAAMYLSLQDCYSEAGITEERSEHEISVTLARILYLMFGDDTDMWEVDAFQTYVHETAADGSDLQDALIHLFAMLDMPVGERPSSSATLPYVNGHIFEEDVRLPKLSQEFRAAILDASIVDWSNISPAIFGSMFQSVRDPKTRRQMGEHYTTERDILKTLDPLFLDDLREELARVLELQKPVSSLRALWKRISRIRVLDPACGCGNFLIIAYRELRLIELQILEALQELEESDGQQQLNPVAVDTLRVRLDHFFGIELFEWGARIAETAMFLVGRQCDLLIKESFGEAPKRLPIVSQATIHAGESALQMDWADLIPADETYEVIVAGNPPYSGLGSDRTPEQIAELQDVWGADYHGSLDYVTAWFKKAADYFGDGEGRWAYVATNSICQGEPVASLFVPLAECNWRISFAHQSFVWTSEAAGKAAVHCVIVGFSKSPAKRTLFEYERSSSEPVAVSGVSNITPYLTVGQTVIVAPRSRPLNPRQPEVFYGNKPSDGGGLIVKLDEYDSLAADPIASKYLRPFVGTRELLHDLPRYCLWFVGADLDELRSSALVAERLDRVAAKRLNGASGLKKFSLTPHLFVQTSHPGEPYLSIPIHISENYPYFLAARSGSDVITSNANFMCSDPDGFAFALISSTMYITWQKTVGGRIKSDPRFNKLVVWNTFPLPGITDESRVSIAEAGQAIAEARELHHDNQSLSEMYDDYAISDELRDAHIQLDRLIDPIFDVGADSTRLERQDRLFQIYKRLSG